MPIAAGCLWIQLDDITATTRQTLICWMSCSTAMRMIPSSSLTPCDPSVSWSSAHGHNAAPSPEADAFLARLHDNLTRAQGALHRATARQKHHADMHRCGSNIKQGDQVLIDATHFGPRDHKLAPLSLGPFHVIQRQGNVLTVTLTTSSPPQPEAQQGQHQPCHSV